MAPCSVTELFPIRFIYIWLFTCIRLAKPAIIGGEHFTTMLFKSVSFEERNMFWASQALLTLLNADYALPIIIQTSFHMLPCCLILHPRWVNFSTSLSSVSLIVFCCLPVLRIFIIPVFLVLILSPSLFPTSTTRPVISFMASVSFTNRCMSYA